MRGDEKRSEDYCCRERKKRKVLEQQAMVRLGTDGGERGLCVGEGRGERRESDERNERTK